MSQAQGASPADKTKKVTVLIRLKPDILDIEGRAIASVSNTESLVDVRKGKVVDLYFSQSATDEEVKQSVEKLCKDVLANQTLETFQIL